MPLLEDILRTTGLNKLFDMLQSSQIKLISDAQALCIDKEYMFSFVYFQKILKRIKVLYLFIVSVVGCKWWPILKDLFEFVFSLVQSPLMVVNLNLSWCCICVITLPYKWQDSSTISNFVTQMKITFAQSTRAQSY